MIDPGLVSIAQAFFGMVTTLGVAYVGWRVKQIEKNTNSMVTQLVQKTEKSSKQEGKEEEKAEQLVREENRNG